MLRLACGRIADRLWCEVPGYHAAHEPCAGVEAPAVGGLECCLDRSGRDGRRPRRARARRRVRIDRRARAAVRGPVAAGGGPRVIGRWLRGVAWSCDCFAGGRPGGGGFSWCGRAPCSGPSASSDDFPRYRYRRRGDWREWGRRRSSRDRGRRRFYWWRFFWVRVGFFGVGFFGVRFFGVRVGFVRIRVGFFGVRVGFVRVGFFGIRVGFSAAPADSCRHRGQGRHVGDPAASSAGRAGR